MNDDEKRTIEWAISFIDRYILDEYADSSVIADTNSVAQEVRDELMYLVADKVIINGKVIRDRSK